MRKSKHTVEGLRLRLESEQKELTKIMSIQQSELDCLPCGGTIGEKGVEILNRLDILEKAKNHISAALIFVQHAAEL